MAGEFFLLARRMKARDDATASKSVPSVKSVVQTAFFRVIRDQWFLTFFF
jgi:hypothetical protein